MQICPLLDLWVATTTTASSDADPGSSKCLKSWLSVKTRLKPLIIGP